MKRIVTINTALRRREEKERPSQDDDGEKSQVKRQNNKLQFSIFHQESPSAKLRALVECSEFQPSPEESTVSEALAVEFETIYVTFFLLSS